jgi:flagellar hook-associated protein 3 FlgL
MRVADKMNYDQVNSSLQKNRSDLSQLQNQAATQKRLNKPSDDPLAATRVLATRTEVQGNQQFLKNINQAKAFLEYSDQSLGELNDLLVRCKELAISQSNDASASKDTRLAAATEVAQLYAQTVQVGNRKQGDRFLFGGFRTTRPPFSIDGTYRGDNGEIKITIGKDAAIAMNVPGSGVFLGRQVQVPASAGPQEHPIDEAQMPANRSPASIGPGAELYKEQNSEQSKGSAAKDGTEEEYSGLSDTWKSKGVNLFNVLKNLEAGLRTNDKQAINESLEDLDSASGQVILARTQLGSRSNRLNSASETLQKGQVEAKSLASSLEDADTFELVTDMNKTESTLKASLETSGKLIQPSLLDFLK